MISVMPLRGIREALSCSCGPDSTPPGPCGKGSGPPLEGWREYAINPASPVVLAALKQQLRETLAAVEAREQVVEAREQVVYESMRPSSLAEISILQSHLTAALDELHASAAALERHKGTEAPERE